MKEQAKIKSPEHIFENFKKYFNTANRKSIFLLTFILGIITHFFLFSALILSQDGLLNGIHYTSGGYEASLGRWGINFFDSLRNNIAFPFITTLISIIVMGFINILLIELFEIKGKIFKILTILSVVVSPSLCMTFLYAYTADAYVFAMLFSVLTPYVFYKMKNEKLGIALGMASFIVMMSVYQSYMGMTVGIILMINIKRLLTEEKSIVPVIKDIVIKAVLLIISALLYLGITIILLKANNLTMSTYKGTNEIGVATIFGSLGMSLKTAYMAFVKYFFADGIVLNRAWKREKLYLVFFVFYAISILMLFAKMIKQNKSKELFARILFTVVLMVLLPSALNLVAILAPGNEIYYLIATQMILVFPFAFMTMELLAKDSSVVNICNWGIVGSLMIVMITYFFSIFVTYQTADLAYSQAKGVACRVIEEMEEYPGYRNGMRVLIAGVIDDVNFPKTLDIYNYTVCNSLRSSLFHGTYWGQAGTWKNFMNIFFGKHIDYCSDFEYYKIIRSEEFEEMEIFPGENSVKIINDVMVVKFTENPALPPMSQEMIDNGILEVK